MVRSNTLLLLGIAALGFDSTVATTAGADATQDGSSAVRRRLELVKPDLSNSSWCGPNRQSIELFLLGVDVNAHGFFAGMQKMISEQLAIHHACVDIISATPLGAKSRRLSEVAKLIAEAALPAAVTKQQIMGALLDAAPRDAVCNQFRVSPDQPCNITGAVSDFTSTTTTTIAGASSTAPLLRGGAPGAAASTTTTTTTTTTTEMPWGMPWWAWFLTCLGVLAAVATVCGSLTVFGATAGGQGKSRSSRVVKPATREEIAYEVVDEPLTGSVDTLSTPATGGTSGTSFVNENGIPMASLTIPWATVTVPAEAVMPGPRPMATTMSAGQSFAAPYTSYAAPTTTRY
mmetsp:Transcript_42616/g.77412  ORF Transcript_42616/g.77412 Transcript_42616/m.77412 type:complete len:346 (+) Transcript_42616:80-1117(+)